LVVCTKGPIFCRSDVVRLTIPEWVDIGAPAPGRGVSNSALIAAGDPQGVSHDVKEPRVEALGYLVAYDPSGRIISAHSRRLMLGM
jgi:hypothetical protein